jgi:uncharacterized delta-60 repeat protein
MGLRRRGLRAANAAIAAAALVLTAGLSPAQALGAAGDPDPGFGGGDGFALLDEPNEKDEGLGDVVVLPDGKILGGGGRGGASGYLLARFNADGSPDTGFGGQGFKVEPDLNAAGSPRFINALALRGDGKLLAVGLGRAPGGNNAFQFGRYLPGGDGLDPMFGSGGMTTVAIAPSGEALALAEAPDGKPVAAGFDVDGPAVVVRLTEGGMPDASFNAVPAGIREVDVPGSSSEQAYTVAVLDDGSIVIGGFSGGGAFLAKLQENGQPDLNFGSAGIAVHDLGTQAEPSGEIYDLAVLPDGRIVAAGASGAGSNDQQAVVARFTPSGDLDPTFGSGGVFRTNPTAGYDEPYALEVLADGRILAAGIRGQGAGEGLDGDTWILRLTADGQLDQSFGAGGESVLPASTQYDAALGMAVQPDGKAVIAGEAESSGASQLFVARFNSDEAVPISAVARQKCKGRRATIVGTRRNDVLAGTGRADIIVALGGNDKVRSRGGNDLVCGGPGAEVIKTGKGRDTALGQAGRDIMTGGTGRDLLVGGNGGDRLFGGAGRDKLLAGPGNDRLVGSKGKRDVCNGGAGPRDRARGGCELLRNVP